MKLLFTVAALLFAVGVAPSFAGDYQSDDCFTGQYREALCQSTRVWHRGKKVVIVEVEPDVIMLPYAPYVVHDWHGR
jgi:hypothetical protein